MIGTMDPPGNMYEDYKRSFDARYNGGRGRGGCRPARCSWRWHLVVLLVAATVPVLSPQPTAFPSGPPLTGNRAPMGIYIHAAWLIAQPERAGQINDFLTYAMQKDNVFLVTISQVGSALWCSPGVWVG